jgi:hypothetical protein
MLCKCQSFIPYLNSFIFISNITNTTFRITNTRVITCTGRAVPPVVMDETKAQAVVLTPNGTHPRLLVV